MSCPDGGANENDSADGDLAPSAFTREVGAEIELAVTAATTLEFQIAIAPQHGAHTTESLRYTCNGKEVAAQEITGEHGNRIHRFAVSEGTVTASY